MPPSGRGKAALSILRVNGASHLPQFASMEIVSLNVSVTPAPKARALTARRLVLLASVAVLGVGIAVGSSLVPRSPGLTTIAYAQPAQRPVGFADIVEKVKPSVISVRVKVDNGP